MVAGVMAAAPFIVAREVRERRERRDEDRLGFHFVSSVPRVPPVSRGIFPQLGASPDFS